MKVYRVCGLAVLLAGLICVSIIHPCVLATNKFLDAFVSHEIMAFLIVILTITFASVANIHLTVGRMQGAIRDENARDSLEQQFARPLKDDTRSSAYLLFWVFCIMALLLVFKGQFSENAYAKSFVHSAGILAVTLNAVVLYDIYQTVFALVSQPETADEDDQDFTGDSPPAG